MSTNVDLEKKIKELATKIVQDPPGNGRRPDNLRPTGRLPPMNFPRFPQQRTNRLEPETAMKLEQIMKRNGIITIDNVEHKTEIKDLEDMGELGNGTSGHVVKMKHKPTNKVIAVKQMRRTNNSEEEKRIIMDIDVVLKSHGCPYIVHCLGCFITDADVWICMELMATCFDKLTKISDNHKIPPNEPIRNPIPEPILGKITVATVNALNYLKRYHDVIHRDVKPSNILIDERGNIKLCDFGISGRLVDSKAKTRSAGCAAYMAPERIDPKKPEYDIRADVWSLGITLVELATGSFPYNGCVTDFEVLTCVLEKDPPSLPTDQGFSNEFQEFVKKCLTKDYRHRPKYPELLASDFIKIYEKADIDVAAWFASVMHTNSQQSNNTEVRRRPSLTVDSRNVSQMPSSTDSTNGPITSSHIPVFQPLNHSIKQSNINIQTNGFNAALQPSETNPFQISRFIDDDEPIASDNQQSRLDETIMKSMSPPNAISSSSSYGQQFSPHLNRKSSLNEYDRAPKNPLSILPGGFVRSPLQSSIQNSVTLNHLLKSTPVQASKSSPPMEPPPSAIPRNDEYTNSRIGHLDYDYAQSETPIVTLEHQRIDHHNRQVTSPQMLHFQQIEERMVDQLNELYKATMLIHSNQQEKPQQIEHNEVHQYNQSYPQREPTFNSGSPNNYLQRNNSLSPFLQRKYSLQAHQQRLNESNIPRWRTPQYGRSISATASPDLEAHRRYQTAIPVLDTDKTQMVRLKGNTSPIVLQRFFHQQSQLREKEANGQTYNSPLNVTNPPYRLDYEKRMNELTEKDHHQTNQFLRQMPKLTHKLNPFKQNSKFDSQHDEPVYANSHIPIYQKQYDHLDGVPKENIHRQRIPVNPPADIYEKTNYPEEIYPNEYNNSYNPAPSPLNKEKKSNGSKNVSDDTGWFNSLAGIVKRRFASYVKSHLATTSGDGSKKDCDMAPNYEHPTHPTSPYHFEKLRQTPAATSSSSSMPSSPYFGNRTQVDQYVRNIDRRHRSPDPPPRYNKGQSPLLLRRNLLEYGNHQVAPSPLLPRRYIISSNSPPLPPSYKGSDAGSPQQLRARIHYTPEPQRRIYRNEIDQ